MRTHPNIAVAALSVALSSTACGDAGRSLSFDVDLRKQVYRADFGNAQGRLPDIACATNMPSPCDTAVTAEVNSAVTGTPTRVALTVGCDASSARCYAQATARVAAAVDVLLDDGFVGKLQGRLVSFVRVLDLAYEVPENTLTFDMPHVEVFVGPVGSSRETDPGVVVVGRTMPVAAMTPLANGHLTVDDGSPAHTTMEEAIRGQQPFGFILVLSPRVLGGDTVPAGSIEVDVTPKLTIGL